MNNSLSVILPVKNSSSGLSQRIRQLLDILPELTNDFEICVVDDGSTDQTVDIAIELAKQYPQVRVESHSESRGILAAVQTAIEFTKADNIIVQSQSAPISPARLKGEWINREKIERHVKRAVSPAIKRTKEDELVKRLEAWCEELKRVKGKSKIDITPKPIAEQSKPTAKRQPPRPFSLKTMADPNFLSLK